MLSRYVVLLCVSGCAAAATEALPSPTQGDGGRTDAGVSTSGGADAGANAPSTDPLPDPNADGPFAFAELDGTAVVASTGDSVAVHVVHPQAAGPFPVVVFGHGFQLPPEQYYGTLKRLASFGYVALTVDFPTSLSGNDNPRQAKDLLGGLDWVAAHPTLGTKADVSKAATAGHSLGGKLALLAATLDPRVKASFVFDPVDGGPSGCTAPKCVVVKDLMPSLAIPTGFVGETLDATGTFQACAPAADNFTTFFAKANAPSVQITALGANHMSFLDDVASCGFTCSFCKTATEPTGRALAMSRALMVAFFERHLRGDLAYDAYVDGAVAQARYVATQEAEIVTK